MKKELLILLIIFILLTFGMHSDEFLNAPLEQIKNLNSSGAYGLGVIHPIVFVLIVYILIFIPRFVAKLFRNKKRG